MALRGDMALTILDKIKTKNAPTEYYLTDAVSIARRLGHRTAAVSVSERLPKA
jgi:bifunctional UDP-N-acetylglucosamine pyrophosphorylase/glucosamine-1-phosphate N-acetyltransferase